MTKFRGKFTTKLDFQSNAATEKNEMEIDININIMPRALLCNVILRALGKGPSLEVE